MNVSAKDSAYFKKTKDYIAPKSLELLANSYAIGDEWKNDRYIMVDYEALAEADKYVIYDSVTNDLDFVIVNYNSGDVFSPKTISFVDR